jgi:hypothetical protein
MHRVARGTDGLRQLLLLLCVQVPGAATLERVGDAIANLGMFAVTSFQGDDTTHTALSEFVACAKRRDVELRQAS